MKLVSISLAYFRQHRRTELSLRNGVTGIIGANGSGKTTLVEAIAFALFGSRALRGKVEDVRTRGCEDGTSVSLLFEHEGTTWRVERTLEDAKFFQGGGSQPIAEGTREVTDRVTSVLGMTNEEFLSTYFTEQKGLEFLRGARGAAERERFVVRMMGYDKLERAQESLRADRRAARTELGAFEAGLGTRAEFERRVEEQRGACDVAKRKHDESATVLSQAEQVTERTKQEFLRYEGQRASWEERSRRCIEARVRVQGLEKQLQELTKAREREHARLAVELKGTLGAIQKAEAELHEHERLGLKGSCPTCGQALVSGFERVQDSLRKRRAELASKKQELESVLTSPPPAAIDDAAADLSAGRNELAGLEAEDQAWKTFCEHLALAKRNYENNSRLLEVSRLQKVRAEGELSTQQTLLARCQGEVLRFDERSAQLITMREKLVVLEESDAILTNFRKHLNATIRPRLSELASEFLAELTDGRYTTIEIGADFAPTLVEDGSPKPVVSGGEEDIINLCLRLALSQMLAERAGHSFSLLILDEVFGSLDDSRRGNVLVLLEKLSVRFEQILIITHLDDVKDGVQNMVYVDYDEATAEVTVGEQQSVPELAVNI